MRRKGLKELKTLGRLLKINIQYGSRQRTLDEVNRDASSNVKSWVFSESPKFERYQPVIRTQKTKNKIEIQKIKDPQANIFKKIDEVKVVAELPGSIEEEIHIEVIGDILSLEAQGKLNGKPIQYHKEILLPFAVQDKVFESRFEKGVLEIKLKRKDKEALT